MVELHVRAVSAQDLKVVQTFGKQDPFCVLSLGHQTFKTRVHDNGHKAPYWNEKFQLQAYDIDAGQLHVEVKDKSFTTSTFIGETYILLNSLLHGQVVDEWYTLKNGANPAGKINLRLQLLGATVNGNSSAQKPCKSTNGPNKAAYAKAIPHASAPPATVSHSNSIPHQGYPGSGHPPAHAPYNNAPPVYGNPTYPQQYPQQGYGAPQGYGGQQIPPTYGGPPNAYAAPPNAAYGAPPPVYGAPPNAAYGAPPPVYGAPPNAAYGAPPQGYAQAPPHGYAQAPPHGYAQASPYGYAQAPAHAYAQAPAQAYGHASHKRKSGLGGGGSGAGMAMGAGAGLLGGLLLGGALDDGPFD